jgi:hypothetical protein
MAKRKSTKGQTTNICIISGGLAIVIAGIVWLGNGNQD